MTKKDDFIESVTSALDEWTQRVTDAAIELSTAGVTPPSPGEEFVGPFDSWKDLKRDFGAVGDGVSSDTAALQAALAYIATPGNSPNLFIPSGTYRVTDRVVLLGSLGAGIIGEDPATTIIKYDGPLGEYLLHLDGSAYGRVSRITLDGGDKGGILIGQSALISAGRQFGTGNEYSDLVMKNAAMGIRAGEDGIGEAESSVLRCSFNGLQNGILLRNFNCLDWYTWDCLFDGCKTGISNTSVDYSAVGAGAFHGYRHVFKGSTMSDIEIGNTGNFNFRDCYSVGSRAFVYEIFYYTNAAPTRIANCVAVPGDAFVPDGAVWQGNGGPTVVTDSLIPNRAITVLSSNGGDLLSVGNTYTATDSISATRLISVDDLIVADPVIPPVPVLPSTPINKGRQVFEVPITDDGTLLQDAINQASALNGQRPIVHISFGQMNLQHSIVVPPCDVQIVGDGWRTRLYCSNAVTAAFTLQSPSQAILRDLYIIGAPFGIVVDGASGGRVYTMQSIIMGATSGIKVENLTDSLVEVHNYSISGNACAVDIEGGSSSRVYLFAGSAGANGVNYKINDGNLVVRDTWQDAPATDPSSGQFATISGNSNVTIEGSVCNLPASGRDAIVIDNLTGRVTVIGTTFEGAIKVTNTDPEKVWCVGSSFTESRVSQPPIPGAVGSLNRKYTGDGSVPVDGDTPSDAFIRTALAQSRETHASIITDLPAGVTDVRMYRVTTENCAVGIQVS